MDSVSAPVPWASSVSCRFHARTCRVPGTLRAGSSRPSGLFPAALTRGWRVLCHVVPGVSLSVVCCLWRGRVCSVSATPAPRCIHSPAVSTVSPRPWPSVHQHLAVLLHLALSEVLCPAEQDKPRSPLRSKVHNQASGNSTLHTLTAHARSTQRARDTAKQQTTLRPAKTRTVILRFQTRKRPCE